MCRKFKERKRKGEVGREEGRKEGEKEGGREGRGRKEGKQGGREEKNEVTEVLPTSSVSEVVKGPERRVVVLDGPGTSENGKVDPARIEPLWLRLPYPGEQRKVLECQTVRLVTLKMSPGRYPTRPRT